MSAPGCGCHGSIAFHLFRCFHSVRSPAASARSLSLCVSYQLRPTAVPTVSAPRTHSTHNFRNTIYYCSMAANCLSMFFRMNFAVHFTAPESNGTQQRQTLSSGTFVKPTSAIRTPHSVPCFRCRININGSDCDSL